MDPDVVVDYELEPRETDSVVRQARDRKCVIGIADIHHHLRHGPLGVVDLVFLDLELDLAVVNISDITLGTGDRYVASILDLLGRITGADDTWNADLATNDRA